MSQRRKNDTALLVVRAGGIALLTTVGADRYVSATGMAAARGRASSSAESPSPLPSSPCWSRSSR